MWSFYNTSTGLFTDSTYHGTVEFLPFNTPPNCAAIEGAHDRLSKRINDKGQVIEYVPLKPADTGLVTWSWDAGIKRWVTTPTLEALKHDKWEEIKGNRSSAQNASLSTPWGLFNHDESSRQAILSIAQAGKEIKTNVKVTLADNSVTELSPGQLMELFVLSFNKIQSIRKVATKLRKQIGDARTVAELETVVWP